MKERAKNNFLGKSGARYNCSQAVLESCAHLIELHPDVFKEHASFGAGRAPGGYCGAFYAAICVLESKAPEKVAECKKLFIERAGATGCRQIRSINKTTCVGCVELAAEFLDKTFSGIK